MQEGAAGGLVAAHSAADLCCIFGLLTGVLRPVYWVLLHALKAYMDGGGNAVGGRLLEKEPANQPTCVAPTCVTNCLPFPSVVGAFCHSSR